MIQPWRWRNKTPMCYFNVSTTSFHSCTHIHIQDLNQSTWINLTSIDKNGCKADATLFCRLVRFSDFCSCIVYIYSRTIFTAAQFPYLQHISLEVTATVIEFDCGFDAVQTLAASREETGGGGGWGWRWGFIISRHQLKQLSLFVRARFFFFYLIRKLYLMYYLSWAVILSS